MNDGLPSAPMPVKLKARAVEKPWGRRDLPDLFPNPDRQRIGEVWFEGADRSELPLLVKYLFTSERLSIQVHPNDARARAHGLAGGKEECWYILDCDEGASLGIGLTRTVSQAEMRAAIADGSIERLIQWRAVRRGDFYYIPPGTVHAIGAGITLVEIQQNADVTYRLYDYGRPRELHLEEGLEVSLLSRYPLDHSHAAIGESRILLAGTARFQVQMLSWRGGESVLPNATALSWFIPLRGSGTIVGQHFRPGECWLLEQAEPITGVDEGSALVAACSESSA
jgi:mannose-6-phosphate isomerase